MASLKNLRILAGLLSVVVCLFAAFGAAASPLGLVKRGGEIPGTLEAFYPSIENLSYPIFGENGSESGTATWRVVSGTGNCCENLLVALESGRLIDFGGQYPRYTDDRGLTWTEVTDRLAVFSGEGALSGAPDGDIVGVGWFPYDGDRLVAFKYTAVSETWETFPLTVHAPFYDRPWLAVVPGPFDGLDAPYIVLLKGGWPSKEIWSISTDGLVYEELTSKELSYWLDGASSPSLQITGTGDADWIQPHILSGITALGGGRAVVVSDYVPMPSCYTRTFHLDSDFRWSCFSRPWSEVSQIDSVGRVHALSFLSNGFSYVISNDDAASVTRSFLLPPGYSPEYGDLKVNGALGIAAVIVHATHENGTSRDFLIKLTTANGTPSFAAMYGLGDGDGRFIGGVSIDTLDCFVGLKDCPRMDFSSVAILPDGKLAASFADINHSSPAIAIEP